MTVFEGTAKIVHGDILTFEFFDEGLSNFSFRYQLCSLLVGSGFEILTLTSDIQVHGDQDQHAFRGRMATFAVLVVTMRHRLFTAGDEVPID